MRFLIPLSVWIGIAEGGARTRDLEVISRKSHTLYRLSYPGKGSEDVSLRMAIIVPEIP